MIPSFGEPQDAAYQDLSEVNNDIFWETYFQPALKVLYPAKRQKVSAEHAQDKAVSVHVTALERFEAVQEEVGNSPALVPYKEAIDVAETEEAQARKDYEGEWRKREETWEEFCARAKRDSDLIEKRRVRDEKTGQVNAKRGEYWAKIKEDPQVQEASEVVKQYEEEVNKREGTLSQTKASLDAIAKKYVDKYGSNFWRRGWNIAKGKWEQILAKKREEWASRDSEQYGQVLEEQSFANPLVIESDTGVIYAAIDAGVPKNGQVKPNEDRVVVIPSNKERASITLVGIDGMGGMGQGDIAAEIFARTVQEGAVDSKSLEEIQQTASDEMLEVGIEEGGVCYTQANITGNRLDIAHAGDTRLIVVRGKSVVLATKDQSHLNVVDNSASGLYAGDTTRNSIDLEEGDIVLIMSDGITDQFVPAHYQVLEREFWKYNLDEQERSSNERLAEIVSASQNPVEAVRKIGEFTHGEMKGKGKPDNRLLILYRHGKLQQ